MPPLRRKRDLLDRVVAAIETSGWLSLISHDTHPFTLHISQELTRKTLIVYVWNLTPGGPSSVRPSGEFRIQMTGVASPLQFQPNSQTLLLGWHEDYGVFAAFDSRKHRTFSGRSPSIQVNINAIEQASQSGFGFYRRGNDEIVVLFTPDQLLNYVVNQLDFHRFGESNQEIELLSASTQGDPPSEELETVPQERQELVRSVRTWVRQKDFRKRVLRAYGDQCAVCRVQLDLVQASHIVPVHVDGSTDLTQNGLALCPNHHQAYDSSLMGIAPNYHILVNDLELQRLQSIGLTSGQDFIMQYVCSTIVTPSRPQDRPNPEYLERGLQVRGWSMDNIKPWTSPQSCR